MNPALTLLFVEDDPRLRFLTEHALKDRFQRVLVASGATEALELFEQNPDIDVVFTDIVMPGGMDGVAMAAIMREQRPELCFLMTSGDPGFKAPTWSHCGFLAKPYGKAPLFDALEAITA